MNEVMNKVERGGYDDAVLVGVNVKSPFPWKKIG
jgi:hypothetical protein